MLPHFFVSSFVRSVISLISLSLVISLFSLISLSLVISLISLISLSLVSHWHWRACACACLRAISVSLVSSFVRLFVLSFRSFRSPS